MIDMETILREFVENKFPGKFDIFMEPPGAAIVRKDGAQVVWLDKDHAIWKTGTPLAHPDYFPELEKRLNAIDKA